MSDINITIRLASKAATTGMDQFGKAAQGASKNLTIFQRISRQASRSLDSFYGNLGANLAFRAFNVITTGLANTVRNMKDFETALVGVGKTTNLSGSALQALGAEVENLSKTIPVASTDLLDLTKTAAQLGITGTQNLLKFTETMARLAVATDIVGEQGAIAFARILNITGEAPGSVDRLGSSIVALGNTFAATESQILAVSNEVAKGGARFGLTAEQILGMSTAMAALGVESQVAGSTTQKVFSLVEKAIGAGGDELKKFTDVLGLADDEFIKLFKTAPDQFFLKLVEGMGASAKGGKELSSVLAELGFNDLRVTKTLGPLIKRTDLLTRALTTSRNAYAANVALTKESEAAFNTLESDLTRLDNTWIAFTNTIVRASLPALKLIVQGLTAVIKAVGESGILIDALAAAAIVGAVALTAMAGQSIIAALATGGLTVSMLAATIQASAMWLAITGPVGLAIAGVAALTVAFQVLRNTTDAERLSALQSARERRIANGQTTESLDEQIRKLESKINLERLNGEIAKGAAVGASTVLKGQIADASTLNAELSKQLGFQINLQKLTGTAKVGADSVLDSTAAKKAREVADAASIEQTRQTELSRLEVLKNAQALKDQFELSQLEKKFLSDKEITDQEAIALQEREDVLATRRENEQAKLLAHLGFKKEAEELALKNKVAQAKRDNDITKKKNDVEAKLDREKEANKRSSLSTIATLQNSNNKTLAAIGKAAALTQIAIDGPIAVTKALAAFPPPFNFAAAAAVGLAVAAQAANVAGVSFEDGGVVPGNSFKGDNVLANVNSGEMILNQQQQAQLFNQANGQSGGGGGDTVIQIDGEEVFRVVSRRVADGNVLGEGGV